MASRGSDRAQLDLDLARLRLLRDRHREAQHAGVVVGVDALEVEVVAEHQLAAEDTAWPLAGQHLPVAVAGEPLGPHGQDVALDVEVDGLRR